MGSGTSSVQRKYSKESDKPTPRAGLTDEEKDMLDAEEEPLENKWEEAGWTCQKCGIAMSDVWGQKLCHACAKMDDPHWREGKTRFKPPTVVYAHHFKSAETHDKEWKMRQQRLEERAAEREAQMSDHPVSEPLFGRNASKMSTDADAARAASKHSIQSRHSSQNASNHASNHEGSNANSQPTSRMPSRKSVTMDDGTERHVKDDTVRSHSKRHSMQHSTEDPINKPEDRPAPVSMNDLGGVPFGDIQGPKLLMAPRSSSKHEPDHHRSGSKHGHGDDHGSRSHSKHDPDHHHSRSSSKHDHHHHHDKRRSTQTMDLAETMEQLSKLLDANGTHLSIGERVIGEGDIGLEMGPGTITGAGASHGHGMVSVQYDDSGHTHPMKSEHLLKLTGAKEAEYKKHKKEKRK